MHILRWLYLLSVTVESSVLELRKDPSCWLTLDLRSECYSLTSRLVCLNRVF